jgi:hypothetical protein
LFCNGVAFACGAINFINGIENTRVDGSIPPLATSNYAGFKKVNVNFIEIRVQ